MMSGFVQAVSFKKQKVNFRLELCVEAAALWSLGLCVGHGCRVRIQHWASLFQTIPATKPCHWNEAKSSLSWKRYISSWANGVLCLCTPSDFICKSDLQAMAVGNLVNCKHATTIERSIIYLTVLLCHAGVGVLFLTRILQRLYRDSASAAVSQTSGSVPVPVSKPSCHVCSGSSTLLPGSKAPSCHESFKAHHGVCYVLCRTCVEILNWKYCAQILTIGSDALRSPAVSPSGGEVWGSRECYKEGAKGNHQM